MASISPALSALVMALPSEMNRNSTSVRRALGPQYASLRVSVKLAPRFQLPNLNGPVPMGLVLLLATELLATMHADPLAMWKSQLSLYVLRVTLTVVSSVTSID